MGYIRKVAGSSPAEFTMPKQSDLLAELIGITLGDGNIGRYKRCLYLRIYFNPKQSQYLSEVEKLLIEFFNKKPYRYFRRDAGVEYLEISKKDIDEVLFLKVGDKIKNKLIFPDWIWEKESFLISCLRGLFDTDGCTYLTGGKYKIVNYCSHNRYLLQDVYKALEYLGFNPYVRSVNVELGRQAEVQKFFGIIKPRNQNHYRFD